MDDPVTQIEGAIRALTQTHPSAQRKAVETFFLPNASFSHPLCRTGSFDGSRFLIRMIYRWYKILSPQIELTVNSIAYDSANLILYVNITQLFRIWAIPFYSAHANLTTVLHLTYFTSSKKYYIRSQNDLYQINEIVRFILPGSFILVWVLQVIATLFCWLGVVVFWPVTWFEENGPSMERGVEGKLEYVEHKAQDLERKLEGAAMPEDALMGKEDGRVNPKAIKQ